MVDLHVGVYCTGTNHRHMGLWPMTRRWYPGVRCCAGGFSAVSCASPKASMQFPFALIGRCSHENTAVARIWILETECEVDVGFC